LALHFELRDQRSSAKPLQDLIVLKENATNCRRQVKGRKPHGTLLKGPGKVRKTSTPARASRLNLRPPPDLVSQEVQDLLCLFTGRLSFVFHPSFKRLGWNPYALSNFGKMLIDDVPVVSESRKLFFGRLHGQRY